MANSWYRQNYCRSDHWRTFSREQLRLRPYCEVCRAARAVELHHFRYKNQYGSILWKEKPSDCVAICRMCHEIAEARKRRYGVAKVYGRRAGIAIRKEIGLIAKETRKSILGW